MSFAAVGLLAITVSTPSRAQDVAVPELVEELFYETCLEYLGGEVTLADDPLLKAKGFTAKPEARQHPRHGPIEIVTAKFGAAEIAFGGGPEKICILMVTGPDRLLAREAIRNGMADLPFEMLSVPVTQPGSGIVHEGFKGKVESGVFYNINLITVPDTAPNAPVAMTVLVSAE